MICAGQLYVAQTLLGLSRGLSLRSVQLTVRCNPAGHGPIIALSQGPGAREAGLVKQATWSTIIIIIMILLLLSLMRSVSVSLA